MKQVLFLIGQFLLPLWVFAQYPGPVGEAGSTAIFRQSSSIVAWGDSVVVLRGWQDPRDISKGKATHGKASDALGPSDPAVVSLGNGGSATYFFQQALSNKAGYDIAIFENAFSDVFLELAFVEISADGQRFFRFPCHSLTQTNTQILSYETMDTRKVHNLAGKYRGQYGTPFDFEELKDSLDVQQIRYVRIVDVVGSIDPKYGSRDSAGNLINDPFPTDFPNGGFDLDAIAVLANAPLSTAAEFRSELKAVYPNPVSNGQTLRWGDEKLDVELLDARGKTVLRQDAAQGLFIGQLPKGLYFLRLRDGKHTTTQKITIR